MVLSASQEGLCSMELVYSTSLLLSLLPLRGPLVLLPLLVSLPVLYNKQHKHPCPERDSNPRFQHSIGVKPTPYTARLPGSDSSICH